MKHGKGLEFNNYYFAYEGEFLFGKRNGNGKEYKYSNYKRFECSFEERQTNLIFEGIYFNGYRLKGKEYYVNGKLKFDGEYLLGQKIKGKFYDYNENVLFQLNNNMLINECCDFVDIIFVDNILTEIDNKQILKGKEYDYYGHLLFEGEYLLLINGREK